MPSSQRRVEQVMFIEGATYLWNLFVIESPDFSAKQVREMVEAEAKRRYPDFDPFPEPQKKSNPDSINAP